MQHPPNHFFDHTLDSLGDWCESKGMPRFRATQINEWVYEKGITDPAAMSSLSKLDRERLSRDMTFLSGDVIRHQVATDGTQKLLIQWHDGAAALAPTSESGPVDGPRTIPLLPVANIGELDSKRQTECVMIPSEDRFTACISSQVGCPVGCRFCASGLGGLDGSLSAGRIVEQVFRLDHLPNVRRITNVVFMGMGEPLANLANVVKAVRTIASLDGMGISARKITISTVGLPKAIEKLAEQLDLPVTLALSLHAPTDDLRRELIPWAEFTTIADLLAACRKWFERTGREITLEYTLLHGVNDAPAHARELAQLATTLRANVNIIRYNEVKGLPFRRPQDENVREFQRILREGRINAHIRASRGRDIAAACGQLRHEAAGANA
ncbi:MAG: 23S rRNA (adenine(2503)-C(2))-methyltransferase RlmN [Phycisphaerae bacterium]|nr:23S rRNA (adenine(2503)-C(2))-methyltransferase RlmN [Phycisphaerae bacterium]